MVYTRNAAVTRPDGGLRLRLSRRPHQGTSAAPKLLDYQGLRGNGDEYGYEVLNFVDGKRTVRDIRDAVSSEYGPVEIALVAEYLRALEAAGVVKGAQ